MTVGGVASNGLTFAVGTAPSITSLSPVSGPTGTLVTITGTNFGSSQGSSTVTFNGVAAVPTSWSATSIAAPVPSGATTGNVVVTVGGVASNGLTFAVGTAPSITSLSPVSGPTGTLVTITGTNFGSSQGSSTVTFNGAAAVPTSWSATSIAAPVPSGATTGNVVVTVGGVASKGLTFTVATTPSITSLSPISGPTGTLVTITGANFGSTQGSSTVTFNGAAAVPTSWSATSIVAPVPSGATTGNVVVTVGGMASNGVSFTVAAAMRAITLAQTASLDAGITTTASLAFKSNNTAGNWIGVVVRSGMSSSQVFTVTDSNGNTYRKAAQIGFKTSAVSLAIYYAENIHGGANTVKVSDTVSGPFRFAILEYAGMATSGSLDVTATATGTSTLPASGNVSTTVGGDLLLGADGYNKRKDVHGRQRLQG